MPEHCPANFGADSIPGFVWFARNSGHRRIEKLHEVEILETLEVQFADVFGKNITTISLVHERSPVADVAQLLNRYTDVMLAGPHGAGLSYMTLARPGSMVLEICPSVYSSPQLIQTCFMDMSAQCGHLYAAAISVEGSAWGNDRLRVSPTSLLAALYSLRSQRQAGSFF